MFLITKKAKKLLLPGLILMVLFMGANFWEAEELEASLAQAQAQAPGGASIKGLDITVEKAGLNKSNNDLPKLAGGLIGNVLAFLGLAFFVLVIYGGILWMTAAGNDDQVKKARQIITAAVIGLVIVLSAYAITAFIGEVLVPTS